MKDTNVDLNPSGIVGVGGKKNPNPMSVFDINPGHYPFKGQETKNTVFDKTRQQTNKGN